MKIAEGNYLARLTRLGCIACREASDRSGFSYDPPEPELQLTVIHHTRLGEGCGQRAQNWLAVPLCVEHHTGRLGIHRNGNRIPSLKLDEADLLALTIELYHRTYG